MSKYFTFEERLQLKRKLEDNLPICQIAEELNKNKSKYIIQKASIQDGDILNVKLQDNNTILLQKISSLEKK